MDRTPTRPGAHWDLLAIVTLVCLFDLLVLLPIETPALRLLLGLVVAMFAPGYAIVAALFPRGADTVDRQLPRATSQATTPAETTPIGWAPRQGLAVVLSVATLGAVALLVNATPWAIQPPLVLAGITAVTVVAAVVARYRRAALPAHHRDTPSIPWGTLRSAVRPRFSAAFFLGIVLVASSLGAVAVVETTDIAASDADRDAVSFLLLTANETGASVTGDYLDTLDDDGVLFLEIRHGDPEPADYTVVLVRERIGRDGNRTVVTRASEQYRRTVTVAADERSRIAYEPTPAETDQPQRIVAYLYRGDAPTTPTRSSADRVLQVWTVADPATALDLDNATGSPS